jgi:hypothetical protein
VLILQIKLKQTHYTQLKQIHHTQSKYSKISLVLMNVNDSNHMLDIKNSQLIIQ